MALTAQWLRYGTRTRSASHTHAPVLPRDYLRHHAALRAPPRASHARHPQHLLHLHHLLPHAPRRPPRRHLVLVQRPPARPRHAVVGQQLAPRTWLVRYRYPRSWGPCVGVADRTWFLAQRAAGMSQHARATPECIEVHGLCICRLQWSVLGQWACGHAMPTVFSMGPVPTPPADDLVTLAGL